MKKWYKNLRLDAKQSKSGFTIIEVVIVLAIAGLIMAIVFLAVPALQRSQRNNARTTDANRLAASVVDWTGTNPGKVPATLNPDCNTIVSNAGSLGSYKFTTCTGSIATSAFPTPAVDAMTMSTGPVANNTVAPAAVSGAVMLVDQDKCSGSSAVTTTGASSSSVALFYAVESGGGFAWNCRDVQ